MNFEDIYTRNDLADLLRIPRSKLSYVLYIKKVDNYYKTFEIPKKSGQQRKICAPTGDLKQIQERLYQYIFEHQTNLRKRNGIKNNISHAFEKRKNIISNAEIHRNKRYVVNIDLQDFFDSFHFGRVRGFFEKNRDFLFSHEVATVLAQLVCYQGKLPQGAPTSPIITNYICRIFDIRVLHLAKKYHLDYTRYADDLTFSTNDRTFMTSWDMFLLELTEEVESAGFKINNQKTCVQYKDSRQKVTGVITNKKINVDRRYYKEVRAMANSLYRKGVFYNNGVEGTIKQLEGKFSFIDQLDKYNNIKDHEQHSVFRLTSREKQYQKFLFYRLFFANEKPIIITEGKTDIKYLKSALKKMHKEYPSLIEKTSAGNFNFKVAFLKRTKKLKYFFGMSQDGADAMKNIFNFFTDEKGRFSNYYKQLCDASSGKPANPVILIFDNELSNKNKPLYSFVKYAKVSDKKVELLKKNLLIDLIDAGNLFLVTNPLTNGKKECEIEDLFDAEILAHEINGKSFSRKDDADSNKCYGKEKFSNYIQSNYEDINFDDFKPMLNNIVKIITEYTDTK